MNDRTRYRGATVVGVVLIAVGAWVLLETVLGPLMWPLHAAVQALAFVGWPLAFIAAGILLLARGRSRSAAATPPTVSSAPSVPPSAPPAPLRSEATASNAPATRLYRSRSNRIVGGVIAGVATHLGVSVDLARATFVVAALLTGLWPAIVVYAIALFVMPEEPVSVVSPAPPVPGVRAPAPPAA